MNEDVRSIMYAQEEEPTEKRPQPEQLRLAGKATVTTINDKQIAIPRMDYVEVLETRISKMEKQLQEQAALIKRLSLRVSNNANIAGKNLRTVESNLKDELDTKVTKYS